MLQKYFIALSIIHTFLLAQNTIVAQTTLAGGRGMLRVQSAQTIQAGSFLINSFFITFLKDQPGGRLHDHTWNIGFTYGLSDRLEAAAQILAYQDDQSHSFAPPGYSQLSIKWHVPLSGRRFHTGIQAMLRLPTTKSHNVQFEPYSSDKIAWGAKLLATYQAPASIPVQINANFGYFDHDIGTFLKKESTDQLLFGLGLKIAARSIIIYTEYSAEVFSNLAGLDFGNNSMRLTQGFKFKAPLNLILDLGGDIGLSHQPKNAIGNVHEYADWKLFVGLTYHFITKRVWGNLRPQRRISKKNNHRSVEQLRTQREKYDKDLENLLNELENESTKNINPKQSASDDKK